MPACERGQIYRVQRVEETEVGFVVITDERAVFGTLELPPVAAGDTLTLGATCAGWTQLVRGEYVRARVLKEPEIQPETIPSS